MPFIAGNCCHRLHRDEKNLLESEYQFYQATSKIIYYWILLQIEIISMNYAFIDDNMLLMNL